MDFAPILRNHFQSSLIEVSPESYKTGQFRTRKEYGQVQERRLYQARQSDFIGIIPGEIRVSIDSEGSSRGAFGSLGNLLTVINLLFFKGHLVLADIAFKLCKFSLVGVVLQKIQIIFR